MSGPNGAYSTFSLAVIVPAVFMGLRAAREIEITAVLAGCNFSYL